MNTQRKPREQILEDALPAPQMEQFIFGAIKDMRDAKGFYTTEAAVKHILSELGLGGFSKVIEHDQED